MGNKLYVGNLPYSVTAAELEQIFSECGKVDDATIIMDRDTGRSKGFGFVTFSSSEEAQNAINVFNGREIAGRAATVNVAKPREDRGPRGGGGGGRGRY